MPFRNITNEFRQIVRDREAIAPRTKKGKDVAQPTRTDHGSTSIEKTYVAEAQNVLNHIHTLTKMLLGIRNAYLNIDMRNPLSRQAPRHIDLGESSSSWANIRYLSNEERDQVDLQARVILTRCSDRIKEMETHEKRRTELVASGVNPLTRFLPARLRQDEASLSSDVIAAHHASITWYLSRRLTEASQMQKELQQERIKRQLERTRTLGSGATQELLTLDSQPLKQSPGSTPSNTSNSRGPGGWLESTIGAAFGAPSQRRPVHTPSDSSYVSEEDEEEIELSASQIMQFEAENANILRNMQDTLESVQQAESRLMDISALQVELVTRLTQQAELTDRLYEDALIATSTVERGNEQLKEAKRRAKDGRLFMLVFLLGASFSLLFLHYY